MIWALLQYLLHDYVYYLLILVLAWFPAVLNAYIGYRIFVFRSKGRSGASCRASRSSTSGRCASAWCVLPILLHVLPFNIYVTQVLFTA